MLELSGEQPGHCREPGVRMPRRLHATGHRDVVGAVVIQKAPRAHQRPLPLWEGPVDGHFAHAAEGHEARLEDLRRRTRLPVIQYFQIGACLEVGHRITFPSVSATHAA